MPTNADASPDPDQPPQKDAALRPEGRVINTQGGDYAEGNIDKRTGAFVEIVEERAYNVAGLRNPYLGLRAFTAAERDIFAGRERLIRALVDRLNAEDGDCLLFIVGASGSGKSSLARAGLLPDLADRLHAEGYEVHVRVIDHPGHLLGTTLARLLKSIDRASDTPVPRFHLILIDQFEELFSQADPAERDQALRLLADVAATAELPVRIIATMRSDFLPQLVSDPRFEAAERRKVVVRAMIEDELRDAIQCPIQVRHPDKRIETALVDQLASDAAIDAAYLPLLQVTLEDLWRGGTLRLGAYHGLADAIQRRADAVYAYRDYNELQQEPRTSDEQQAMLDLFLALVRVSLDEKQHDIRWRRPRGELTQGDPQCERLITDLATARLLRTDREVVQQNEQELEIQTVDIVHEALLNSWPTLRDAIDAVREALRQRVRFDQALTEWRTNECGNDYLLTGVRLAEAESLKQKSDGIFHREDAQKFYEHSVRQHNRRLRRTQSVVVMLAVLLILTIVGGRQMLHTRANRVAV